MRYDKIREEKEIFEEATDTWNLGKKLGLKGKISDEAMVEEISKLERAERQEKKKGKKIASKG